MSARVESFLDLGVAIPDEKPAAGSAATLDLTALLDALWAPETLAGDNQYHCDGCARKTDALRQVSDRPVRTQALPPTPRLWQMAVTEAPALLTVTLLRFAYDITVRGGGSMVMCYKVVRPCLVSSLDGLDGMAW